MESSAAKFRLDWTALAGAIAMIYVVFLASMFIDGFWLRDASGHILANDFIDVFAAGKLAASGHAASAYDWTIHRATEVAIAGHQFDGYFGWHYPPPFLFAALALSCLPYFAAFFIWIAITLAPIAFVIAHIAERREAALWALAFPAVLLDAYVGQNGLFTAALFGAMLLTLKERPVLAGIFIGLLTYKPQFGLLIPVALIAGGYWRTFVSAAITAAALALLSIVVFGLESWIAFLHSIPHTADMILAGGHAGWNKLQTVYGFARWIGASDSMAWIWQIFAAVVMSLGIFFAWRSRMPFALKAAALCVTTLLVTPYAYIYDFPLLAVAIAFLYRHRTFDTRESITLLGACALVAIFPWVGVPTGLASTLSVAAVVTRRVYAFWRQSGGKIPDRRPAQNVWVVGAAAVVFGYVISFALLFMRHAWVVDTNGHPKVTDFLAIWVAGLSALKGAFAAPYDWHLHHAAQVAVAGHPFNGFLGWQYPPLFLLVAAALALLPYAWAFIAWAMASAALYAGVVAKIARRKEAALFALVLPAAFGNVLVGQNGFLTAAIAGSVLLTLENKPVISGLFLAFLTYKPQFGLMFPLVLLAEGNWRVLISAAGFTALLYGLCWLIFGTAPFVAFIDNLPTASATLLGHGAAGFGKVQSVYGLMRWLGQGERTAWVTHGFIAVVASAGLFWLWRRNLPYALKAAGLVAATLITTPYLFMYDFPLLALSFAFLFRDGSFDPLEIAAAVAINLIMLVFAWSALPLGPILVAVPAALLMRRLLSRLPADTGDVALQRA